LRAENETEQSHSCRAELDDDGVVMHVEPQSLEGRNVTYQERRKV
jgi:hypothetical protein